MFLPLSCRKPSPKGIWSDSSIEGEGDAVTIVHDASSHWQVVADHLDLSRVLDHGGGGDNVYRRLGHAPTGGEGGWPGPLGGGM